MSLQSLERLLGRALDEGARGSVATLNELDETMEAEARGLARRSRVAAHAFLQFHVRLAEADHVGAFIDSALISGESTVHGWGRRDLLCYPRFALPSSLMATADDLVAPVGGQDGERWYCFSPTVEDWHWSGMGAPAVLVRDAPYHWAPTTAACDTGDIDADSDEIEPITNIEVATRRWIASRVAWPLSRDLAVIQSVPQACQLLGIDTALLSVDAALAIRGLLKTCKTGDGVPGFTGSDSAFLGGA